jgi:hypothetical protein
MQMSLELVYGELTEWSDEERTIVQQKMGFDSNYMIKIDARCNDTIDRRLLGRLSLECCERFHGLIDLGGALFPPSSLDYEELHAMNWRDAERHSREYFDKLPGTLITVSYKVSEERDWFYYVADTTFMRAWLADPNFYMIK